MATRVNTRFVVLLSTVLGAIVLGMVGFWYGFVQKDPAEMMRQGDRLMADDKPNAALAEYGPALRLPDQRTNLTLIDKYVAALRVAPVENASKAEKYFKQIRHWMRRAAELRPEATERLEAYYQYELDLARRFGGMQGFNRLHELTSAKLEADPDNTVARKYRGIAQVHRLSTDSSEAARRQALEDLQAAREQRPDDAELLYHLANWHLIEARRLRDTTGRADAVDEHRAEALSISKHMLSVNPEDADRRLKHLRVLAQPALDGQTEAARDLARNLAKQLADDPTPTRAVRRLAELLPRLDRRPVNNADPGRDPRPGESVSQLTRGVQRARQLLEAAVEKRPDATMLLAQLGRLRAVLGDQAAAIDAFEAARRASESAPAVAYLLQREGRLAATLQLSDLLLTRASEESSSQQPETLERVEALLDEIADASQAGAQLRLLRGKLAMLRGRSDVAAIKLDQAIDRFDTPPTSALLLSATAHEQLDNWGTAVDRLQTLLERHPDAARVRVELARMQLDGGQLKPAGRHIDHVLQRAPAHREARRLKVRLLARRGQTQQAATLYEQLAPDARQGLLRSLARALVENGDRPRALDLIDQRRQRDPTDPRALQLMVTLAPQRARQRNVLAQARQAGANEQVLDALSQRLERGREATVEDLLEQLAERQQDPFSRALVEASIAQRRGDWDALRQALNEAAELKPDHERVLQMRFALALRDEDWQLAEQLARRAGERNLDLAHGSFFMARLAATRGELAEASARYRRALEARPVFSEGWRRLGDVLRRQDDLAGATDAYRTAVDQKPDNVAARRGLAEVLRRRGEHQAALEQLRAAVPHAPGDGALVEQYVRYERRHGDPQRALQLRQRLMRLNPNDLGNRRSLALLLAQQDQPERALQIARGVIEEDGRSRQNVLTLAMVHRTRGAPAEGDQLLQQYVERRGDEATPADYALLARYRLSLGDFQRALSAYRAGMAHESEDAKPITHELAELLFSRGAYAQAAALYRQLHELAPDDKQITLRLGEALVRADQLDDAQQILDGLDESPTANALRGLVAARRGETQRGLTLLTRAIDAGLESATVYFQRANLHFQRDALESAADDVRAALERNAELLPARLLLGRIAMRQGRPRRAIDALGRVLEQAPAQREARLRLVSLYRSQGRLDDASALLDEAARLFPDEPIWPRRRAELALQRGNRDGAVEHFRGLIEIAPTVSNVADLVTLHLSMQQPEPALSLLREHAALTNRHAPVEALRGRALAAAGQTDAAERVFTRALGMSANVQQLAGVATQMAAAYGVAEGIQRLESAEPDGTLPELWRQVAAASVLLQRGQMSAVRERLEPMRDQVPQADEATRAAFYRLLGAAQHQSGAHQAARRSYERLLEIWPEHVSTLNNLAYLLANDLSAVKAAMPLAKQAAKLAPQNARVLDTLGWVQFHADQWEAARRTLERSRRLQPLAETCLHLGRVYEKLDEPEQARARFEQAARLAEQADQPALLNEARRRLSLETQP